MGGNDIKEYYEGKIKCMSVQISITIQKIQNGINTYYPVLVKAVIKKTRVNKSKYSEAMIRKAIFRTLNACVFMCIIFSFNIYWLLTSHETNTNRDISSFAASSEYNRQLSVSSSPSSSSRSSSASSSEAAESNIEWKEDEPVKVSVVILTYKKRDKFIQLLPSVASQKTDFKYEIIIADAGCLPGLFDEITDVLTAYNHFHDMKYMQICDNPGYSIGNNLAVEQTDPATKFVLYLNDDLILRDSSFLQNMVNLYELQINTAGAVGCMLLNDEGNRVLEAGSIVWNDGSTQGYARDRTDIEADDLQYTRPVDFISGACLMVEKQTLNKIGGFDGASYPAYYEDTDMQMAIQHKVKKYVWLQPLAVALHMEHGSFGASSVKLMENSHAFFSNRWNASLVENHIYPGPITSLPKFQSFRASDIRGRRSSIEKPNVLYIVETIPSTMKSSGRVYDSLVLLSQLGLRITVLELQPTLSDHCNKGGNCERRKLQQHGVEVIRSTETITLQTILEDRPNFYNVIIINRPTTYKIVNDLIPLTTSELTKNSAIIYAPDALQFLQEQQILRLSQERISLSDLQPTTSRDLTLSSFQLHRAHELAILSDVDGIVTVSDMEKDAIVNMQLEGSTDNTVKVVSIGHVISPVITKSKISKRSFDDRYGGGLLFLGNFNDDLVNRDGDAILYFIRHVYPLIIQENPISLTIAGQGIPQYLYDYVKNNLMLAQLITFIESPRSINILLDKARVLIAPHLYGTGFQESVATSMAAGLPIVISNHAVEYFDTSITDSACISSSDTTFKNCVLSVHDNQKLWEKLQSNSFKYLDNNTDRHPDLKQLWKTAIQDAILQKGRKGSPMIEWDGGPLEGPGSVKCKGIDQGYISRYEQVKKALNKGKFSSGLEHFHNTDSREGFIYNLAHEKLYLFHHPEVQKMIEAGQYKTGWDHFKQIGQTQPGFIYSIEDENEYRSRFPDVDDAVKKNAFPNAWHHFYNYGRPEKRVYGCW